MTEHTIWVVCATRGDYSDCEFWVVCWAITEADAQGLAETFKAEQEKFRAAWKVWTDQNGYRTPLHQGEEDYYDRKKLAFLELSSGMLITPSMYDEIEFTVEKVSDVPAQT